MKKWIVGFLVILSLLLWAAVVLFALPLVGFGEARPFAALWVRLLLIGLVWFTAGLIYLLRFLKRRKAEKALEEAIAEPEVTGDGEVLSEKMSDALTVLKKSSGSKAYLYDLPWYVIIGPPGAGKTTALLNSGIKFPLAEKGQGAVAGVGGTRYVDWWFSEEAVLIDTAGRYTTQDSDAEADSQSWQSFLRLLKTNRTNQPINGVIVAISLQEVLAGTPAELDLHAETIRKRLMEIQEELKVEFPVYVVFTKADLISGFMEYFGSFSASRRQKVWGHTFQTDSKKEQTVERFGVEYDALVSRLSEEVTDRLSEEPDGVNRIAIFGFPGQVAMLKDKLQGFMQGVFAHSRYKVSANLRGFYFSSGTQEGTPIDSVLGAMQRNFGNVDASVGRSGAGRSYFLHDLLRKVIFAEAGWVSTDKRAVRRQKILRYTAISAIALGTVAMIGLWSLSFYQNRELIRTAEAAISDYELAAQDELQRTELGSFDLQEVVGYLDLIRNTPLGYGESDVSGELTERFGLSQRDRMSFAAITTYRQALERMFRSRLILRVEAELESRIRKGEIMPVYDALKVYKLLGDLAPSSDDEFVRDWFDRDWRQVQYPGPAFAGTRQALDEHLAAMLELDNDVRTSSFELNGGLIEQAERLLARMEVADQAYSLILANAETAGIEPFDLALRAGRDAELVFETHDGTPLEDIRISPLYTYFGFHQYFLPQLFEIGDKLSAESWVLGTYADAAKIEDQLAGVGPQLLARYTEDWIAAWDGMLGNLKSRPMVADKPAYQTLAGAGAPRSSPFVLLAEQIALETTLTNEYENPRGGAALAEAAGQEAGLRLVGRYINSLSGNGRIIADSIFGNAKNQGRLNGSGGAQRLPGAQIENYYADWQQLAGGDVGSRPLDALVALFRELREKLVIAVDFPEEVKSQLNILTGTLSGQAASLPDPYEPMILAMARDIKRDGDEVEYQVLADALNTQVTSVCEAVVPGNFPFSRNASRDMPITEFSRLFAPQGLIDRFFLENLSQFVDVSGQTWRWQEDAPREGDLSQETLRNFQRAAEIRDAFFAFGGGMPQVSMTVTPTSMHRQIKTAVLNLNGQVMTTRRRGKQPANLNWPGSGGAGNVLLQFTPSMRNRESELSLSGGWSFLRFLKRGQPKMAGASLQVRYTLGGRDISYRIDVAGEENPFFLPALSEFKCPKGL